MDFPDAPNVDVLIKLTVLLGLLEKHLRTWVSLVKVDKQKLISCKDQDAFVFVQGLHQGALSLHQFTAVGGIEATSLLDKLDVLIPILKDHSSIRTCVFAEKGQLSLWLL